MLLLVGFLLEFKFLSASQKIAVYTEWPTLSVRHCIPASCVPETIFMDLLYHLFHSNSGYIFPWCLMFWAGLAMVSKVYDEALFKEGRLGKNICLSIPESCGRVGTDGWIECTVYTRQGLQSSLDSRGYLGARSS